MTSDLVHMGALWGVAAWISGVVVILASDWMTHGVDRSYLRGGTGEQVAFTIAVPLWPLWAAFMLARRLA